MQSTENILDKPGPLEGVKVVEYGIFHAGPGACAILGDLGADIVKVETADGDPIRHWSKLGKMDIINNGRNLIFEMSNRNKRSIALDIKTPEGREIFNSLIKGADVFLTNLRKETKSKLSIDYESISEINPQIVYSSISGYGKEGPLANAGAFDPLGQARSGMMFLVDAEKPTLIQLAILDQATAITASHAIITALFVKERHGIGQEVHNSLYSSALWLMLANFLLDNFGLSIDDIIWVHERNHPLRNAFRCADDKWIIGTHHPLEKYWPLFCETTGQEFLLEDERFKDTEGQIKHCAELVAHFDRVFASRPRRKWMEIFENAEFMFTSVQHINEVMEDPQAIFNNYVATFLHPEFGQIKVPGYPVEFSRFSAGFRKAAPSIGEHTDEIMEEMGFSDREIERLKKDGICA